MLTTINGNIPAELLNSIGANSLMIITFLLHFTLGIFDTTQRIGIDTL